LACWPSPIPTLVYNDNSNSLDLAEAANTLAASPEGVSASSFETVSSALEALPTYTPSCKAWLKESPGESVKVSSISTNTEIVLYQIKDE